MSLKIFFSTILFQKKICLLLPIQLIHQPKSAGRPLVFNRTTKRPLSLWDSFAPGQSVLRLGLIHHDGTKAKLNNFDPKVAVFVFFLVPFCQKKLFAQTNRGSNCPKRHGLVVRAVASEAKGPGFDSSSDQVVFILSLGVGGRKINGSGNDNHVILRIHVDKKER